MLKVPARPPRSSGSLPRAPAPAVARLGTTNEPARTVAPVTSVRVTTWLTNSQGCVVYRGSAFPSNYLGNVFVADPSAHIIHRFVLHETGLDVTAARALTKRTPNSSPHRIELSPGANCQRTRWRTLRS